jgi:16S rRNA (cytosine1402-N4)-methyltransferase
VIKTTDESCAVNVKDENSPNVHIPVLKEILSEYIHLPDNAVIVDATVGHGGHSSVFGKSLGPEGAIIGLDVDEKCLEKARLTLAGLACKVVLVCANFSKIAEVTQAHGVEKVDFILADLGVCSSQLSDSDRGLSFQENMPLDMRLDSKLSITASDIVNNTDEKSLADLIYNFGQERASRRIARFIVENRDREPITTTMQLSMLVCRALNVPPTGRKRRLHPATRTFQALRMAVNDELPNLQRLLQAGPQLLKKAGWIAVISFHSLEDKIVKENFRKNKTDGIYEILTKKPIVPLEHEIAQNPRSRSAKLRIARLR